MLKVKFKEWNCIAKFANYNSNNRVAIQLVEETTREPIATDSVNLTNVILKENQIAIKDYSENEGMAKALQKAGIIGELKSINYSGHVKIGIYELLKTN